MQISLPGVVYAHYTQVQMEQETGSAEDFDSALNDPESKNTIKTALVILSSLMSSEEMLRSTISDEQKNLRDEAITLVVMGFRLALQANIKLLDLVLMVNQLLISNNLNEASVDALEE